MRTALKSLLIVLLVVSASLAKTISFSNWMVNASPVGVHAIRDIRIDPSNNSFIWINGSKYNKSNGDFITGAGSCNNVCWDKAGNVWAAASTGLYVMPPSYASYKVFVKADGLPSTNCLSVVYDSSNSRLLIATDSGLAIWNLDASGNVTTKSTALSGKIIWQACFYKNEIWAIDNQKNVYHYNVTWVTSQPNSSNIGQGGFLALDTAGEAYAPTSSGIRRYNKQTTVWDSVSTISEVPSGLKIDRDNNLWFVSEHSLGRKNLSTGAVDTIARNGSITWLGDATNWPILSLTPAGYLLIGGIDSFAEQLAPNAISWSPIQKHPKLTYKVIGYVDLLGRQIVKKNINNSSPGTYFTVLRASDGTQIIQRGLQLK